MLSKSTKSFVKITKLSYLNCKKTLKLRSIAVFIIQKSKWGMAKINIKVKKRP